MSDKAFPAIEHICNDYYIEARNLDEFCLAEAIEELEAARELLQAILCMGMQLDGGWTDTPQVSRVVSAISACQPKERE